MLTVKAPALIRPPGTDQMTMHPATHSKAPMMMSSSTTASRFMAVTLYDQVA